MLTIPVHAVKSVCFSFSEDMTLSLSSHLHIVQNAIHGAQAKWYLIGVGLQVNVSTLDNIKSTCTTSSTECLCQVLIQWLKAIDPKPTWRALVDVLRTPVIDEKQLAADLAKQYCSCNTESRGNDTYLADTYVHLLTQVATCLIV